MVREEKGKDDSEVASVSVQEAERICEGVHDFGQEVYGGDHASRHEVDPVREAEVERDVGLVA